MVYMFCEDVDSIYAEFEKKGVQRITKPEDQDYSMRDFDLIDPEGNRLTFGTGRVEG